MSDSHGQRLGTLFEEYGVYNFSADSDSYIDMLRKLKYIIMKNKVKLVIITVDDHTLSPYREQRNNHDRSSFFVMWDWKIDSKTYNYVKTLLKRYIVLLNPKSIDFVKGYLLSKLKKKLSENKMNWDEKLESDKEKGTQERFDSQFKYRSKSYLLESALNEIIAICEQNDIELVGIKYPLSNDYIRIMGNTSFGADDIFRNNNLTVHDFKHLYVEKDNYFSNTDHLNKTSAREFVTVSAKIILNETKIQNKY